MTLLTSLYKYQEAAAAKLLPLRIGALYMEMGTGKTRTALELVSERLRAGRISRVLWLCPCSVKQNLADDLDKHAAEWQNLIRICGIETLSASDRVYLDLLKYVDAETMCIVDESNLVKNWFAKRTKRITELGKPCRYRMILNGTPVSRNEADLYAQWYFLDPRIFGYRTFWSFAANHLEYDEHHRVRQVLDVDYLAERIAPWSVVIKREDVLKLPDKSVSVSSFWLSDEQERHYDDVMDQLLGLVDEFDERTIYRLFTGLQLVTSGRLVDATGAHLESRPFFHDPRDNPRIAALLDEVSSDNKTVIWVKYRHEAEAVRSVLPAGSHATATGEIPVKRRADEIRRFCTDPTCRFLVSNKVCGGYGLNLQASHKAVYFNNDFNFATRAQSEDRIYRIGQEHDVEIVDIAAQSKIDMRILDCLRRKKNMSDEMKEEISERGNLRDWLNPGNLPWLDVDRETQPRAIRS